MNIYKLFYNIIGTTLALISLPVWLTYVLCRRKYRLSFIYRLGKLSPELKQKLAARPNIWLHAVSVGEFLLAKTVITELKKQHPDYQVVVSVTTLTGYAVAKQKLDSDDQLIYFPLEFYPIMMRMVKIVNPKIAIITETEIWPNFIYCLEKLKIPILMMNGRLSEKSFSRYSLVKPFIKNVLCKFSSFQMQNETAAERVKGLGAKVSTVCLSGNIKFDSAKVTDAPADQELMTEIEIPQNQPVLIMAALEKTGREDPIAIDVLEKIRATYPKIGLIIVPRHPERGNDIARLVTKRGYEPAQRSKLEKFKDPLKQIFIVDTVGELKRFYTLAKVVFVGKSLFEPGGGQNMIEPIALGRPTLYGPYTRNFRGISDQLASHKGALIVKNAAEIAASVKEILLQAEVGREMVKNGQGFIRQNQGATARTLAAIGKLIEEKEAQ